MHSHRFHYCMYMYSTGRTITHRQIAPLSIMQQHKYSMLHASSCVSDVSFDFHISSHSILPPPTTNYTRRRVSCLGTASK